MSSGRISTGVWQPRTKSRVTVKTKSASVRYIFVRKRSTVAIVRVSLFLRVLVQPLSPRTTRIGPRTVRLYPLTGSLFVRARPSQLRAVAELIERNQAMLGRQVLIEAQLIDVQLSEADFAALEGPYEPHTVLGHS